MEKLTFREYALAKTAEACGLPPYCMGYPERGTLKNDANAGAFAGGSLGASLMALFGPDLERDEAVMETLKSLPIMENGKLPARWKAAGMLGAGLAGSIPGGLLGMAHHGVRSSLFDD